MPLVAKHVRGRPQWLGSGLYFWNSLQDAFEWALKKHRCHPEQLLCVEFEILDLQLNRIFDFQNNRDHLEMVIDALEDLRIEFDNETSKLIPKELTGNEELFISDAIALLVETRVLQDEGFYAITYSEATKYSPSLEILMSPKTKAKFVSTRKQICLLDNFTGEIKKMRIKNR